MSILTLEQHRQRIENIRKTEEDVIKCHRKQRVRDYLPGQVTYNLGEYPAKFSIEPSAYDYNW